MGLETVTYINDLNSANPLSTDKRRQGDDHLRVIKSAIKATFPNIDGAVTVTPAQLNYLSGVTSGVQSQLDGKVTIATAPGDGLTESGGALAVGPGLGIAVNADDVAIDLSGLAAVEGNELVSGDGFLADVGGVPKRMQYTDAGLRVIVETTVARTLVTSDMNAWIQCTNGAQVDITLNAGVGKQGNHVVLQQDGLGQIVISGTATLNNANGLKTSLQNSVIILFCTAADTWVVFGDAVA